MKKFFFVGLTLLLALSQQGCGKNSAPVNLGGTMTQQVQLGIDPNMGSQIQKAFWDIFNRQPTAQELAQYQQLISTGSATIQQIKDALAHSQEAQTLVNNLLVQYFGTSSAGSISAWLSALAGNTTLADIIKLFSGA